MKTACAWITVNMTVSFSFMDWILHSQLIPKKNMKPNNHVPASMAGAVIDDLARTNKKNRKLSCVIGLLHPNTYRYPRNNSRHSFMKKLWLYYLK